MRKKSEDKDDIIQPVMVTQPPSSIYITQAQMPLPAIRQLTEVEVRDCNQPIHKLVTLQELQAFAEKAFQDDFGKLKKSQTKVYSQSRFYGIENQIYELPYTLIKAGSHPLKNFNQSAPIYVVLDNSHPIAQGSMSKVKKVIELEKLVSSTHPTMPIQEAITHCEEACIRKKITYPELDQDQQSFLENKEQIDHTQKKIQALLREKAPQSSVTELQKILTDLQVKQKLFVNKEKEPVDKHQQAADQIKGEILRSPHLTGQLQLKNAMYLFFCDKGENLREYLQKRYLITDAFSFDEKLALAIKVAFAVNNLAVYHRDIKPENLVIDAQGVVHCIDFALSSAKKQSGNVAQSTDGTSCYLPAKPCGKNLAALDRFALMRVLYMPKIIATKNGAENTDDLYSIFTTNDIKNYGLSFLNTKYDESIINDITEQNACEPLTLMRAFLQRRIERKRLILDPKYLQTPQDMLLINELLTNVVQRKDKAITPQNIADLIQKNDILRVYAPLFLKAYVHLLTADTQKKFFIFKHFNTAQGTLDNSFLELCEKAVNDKKSGNNSRTYRAFVAAKLINREGKLIPEIDNLRQLKQATVSFVNTNCPSVHSLRI